MRACVCVRTCVRACVCMYVCARARCVCVRVCANLCCSYASSSKQRRKRGKEEERFCSPTSPLPFTCLPLPFLLSLSFFLCVWQEVFIQLRRRITSATGKETQSRNKYVTPLLCASTRLRQDARDTRLSLSPLPPSLSLSLLHLGRPCLFARI